MNTTQDQWAINSAIPTEVNSNNGIAIADFDKSITIPKEEKIANALLASKAPELASALYAMVEYCCLHTPEYPQCLLRAKMLLEEIDY